MSGFIVVSDKLRSPFFAMSRQLRTFDNKQVTQLNVGKAIKCSFTGCAVEDGGQKGTSDTILNFKYFI
jgi:hypothetical protein